MIWRQCVGFPDYEVSENGDVRRLTRGGRRYRAGYRLTVKTHARGYLCYTLKTPEGRDKTILAHRLVALTFIGLPSTECHEVAHDDGTRINNHWRNLRWALPIENQHDRKRHGTWHQGERCGSAKVADVDAEVIRARYAVGGTPHRRGGSETMRGLAAEFGISIAQISRIVNGRQRTSSAGAS